MRFGFDIDDTTGCFSDLLILYALEYDKTLRNKGIINKNKYIIRGMFDWTSEETLIFLNKYANCVAENMKVKEGAREIINYLRWHGNQVYFITARSFEHYDNPYLVTINWLKNNGICYDEVIVNALDKIEICKRLMLDYYMDDIASICKKIANENIDTYLMDSDLNRQFDNAKVKRVLNWYDFGNKVDLRR